MYAFGYGKEQIHLRWRNHLTIDTITYQQPESPLGPDRIHEALDHPIASPSLVECARNKKNAVILISDRTRLSPSHLFCQPIIDQLNQAGIRDDNITIIVALGLHRKQTEKELMELVGKAVYQRVRVLNHSALPEDCLHLGHTSHGTPVEINRKVVEADFRIATGNIEPHRLVGMSGGVKALFPGTASSRAIEHHHAMSQQYRVSPGNIHNPLHQDLEEILRFVPIDFLLNVIVNHQRQIMDVVSGDVIQAHRAGLRLASQWFLVPVFRKYDLVVASTGGDPKDMQLYQAVKTLQNAAAITKPGGSIILIAKCEEGFGNGIFQYWVETIQNPNEIARRLQEKFVLGAHKIEQIYTITKKHQVYMYTEIPPPLVELLGIQPIQDLQQTCDELTAPLHQIAVMPYGALTFPQMQS